VSFLGSAFIDIKIFQNALVLGIFLENFIQSISLLLKGRRHRQREDFDKAP
jgi:hypothetical protein